MQNHEFWEKLRCILKEERSCYLVIIVAGEGSAPNRPGAKMFVTQDGVVVGTVGGGQSEHDMIDRAKGFLAKDERIFELVTLHHNKEAAGEKSGMICSGSQTYALVPVGGQELEVVEKLGLASQGVLVVTNDSIVFKDKASDANDVGLVKMSPESWRYTERFKTPDQLYIIGAGHCGLALSRLMATLDFQVTVFDNRPEVATYKDNTYAHEKRIVDYESIAQHVDDGDSVYVVIMTFGHAHDQLVLEKLVNKDLKYLGMMGSATKVKKVFENLKQKGVSAKVLERVRAPVGLPIGSNTPEEIAVSVAAEIVQMRNLSGKS